MKKTTALILALILGISMTACNGGTPSGSEQDASSGEDVTAQEISFTGEIGGEITVSCYETMSSKAYLDEAAKLFEEKYPGTKVNVETFSAMPEIKTSEDGGNRMQAVMIEEDPQAKSDYISKVNTDLMSGGGSDILAMDVLPIQKLAESGRLENLDSYMDSDAEFNRSDYRGNILDAIKYNGGTWFLPMDYMFDYYVYDSTLVTGDAASAFGTGSAYDMEELIGIAEPMFDGSSKVFNMTDYLKEARGAGLFSALLNEAYTSFVDVQNKTANFKDGSFEALLDSVKEYAELGYVPTGVTGQMDAGQMMRGMEEAPTDRYFYKSKNNFSLIQHFNRNSSRRMMMNIMTGGTLSGIEDDDEIAGIKANKDGSVPFEYQQAYGINSNSQNKETAWAFIKFLLGEEMQLSTNLNSLSNPVLNSAREKKAEMVLSGEFMGRGEPLDDEQREVLRNYVEAETSLADQINTFTIKDGTVDDMIASEVAYFFEGTKSASEVADVLQSKVDLYLNE